ncbi:hypothetical protein SDC9_178591 [bioreactor metagenome]|uniref:Uncharacterized protein n=1 Tax=bioreactor metagenome TaxID=1076179 RepID=A0A645GWN9_9ZZZZ
MMQPFHQRTGGIDYPETAPGGLGLERRPHAVGAPDQTGAGGDFIKGMDEADAAPLQVLDHEIVVHDLMVDAHRS